MSTSVPPAAVSSGTSQRLAELVEQLAAALKAGAAADADAIFQENPEHQEELRRLLPALQMLADLSNPEHTAGQEEMPLGLLGDFRLVREVGRGGMGVVYEAQQISLSRRVALKVLPFAATMDARQLQRFQNEVRAAASLQHPHIVPVYAVGCERGVHYYAMQFIEGFSLEGVIRRLCVETEKRSEESGSEGQLTIDNYQLSIVNSKPPHRRPLSPEYGGEGSRVVAAETPRPGPLTLRSTQDKRDRFRRVAEWGIQAAKALEHAHSLGMVHRDIKPANLLVDAQGQLWVTDFGLARTAANPGLTMTGDVVGTLRYMSPEQASAKHGLVDHRTDVYALGATLYELLTLKPAVGGKDREEILRNLALEEPKKPRSLNSSIPADLETIVLKALAKEPSERYASAQELAEDLERFVKDEPIKARRPALRRRARAWCRRHRSLVTGIVMSLLTLLLLSAIAIWWQVSQRAATEQAVTKDLEEAEVLQRQEQWAKAVYALERAKGRLEGSGLAPLQAHVEARHREVALVAQLQEARLKASLTIPGLGKREGDRLYGAAFGEQGLGLEASDVDKTARQIRASAIRNQLVAALDDWAFVKDALQPGTGDPLRAIVRLADDDPWRQQVRNHWAAKDREALLRLAERDDVLTQPPGNLLLLSDLLGRVPGPLDREVLTKVVAARTQFLRRAQLRYPAEFWINWNLASSMYLPATAKGKDTAEGIGFLRAALALQPQYPELYLILGHLLWGQKNLSEAVLAYRKAIELQPGFADAYENLGHVLREQRKLPAAVVAYRRASELQANNAAAYHNLGAALHDQRKLPQAEAAFRKAIELKPGYAEPHYSLGVVLREQQRMSEAAAAWRKAIDFDPDHAWAHWNLGVALLQEGDFAGSLSSLKRGHELGSRRPDRFVATAELLRKAEQFVLLDAKLPKVMSGEIQPTDASERTGLAGLCQLPCRQLYATAARFYGEAFAAEPNLGNDLPSGIRYNAACAAALAGCGQGKDAAKLVADEYAHLREQALEWLQADLSAWRSGFEKKPKKDRSVVLQKMRHWQQDSDFDGVRSAAALAKLPEAERQEWQKLWQEVEELRQRTVESRLPAASQRHEL